MSSLSTFGKTTAAFSHKSSFAALSMPINISLSSLIGIIEVTENELVAVILHRLWELDTLPLYELLLYCDLNQFTHFMFHHVLSC